MRGCSARPTGTDTLCQRHAQARDIHVPPHLTPIGEHRLQRALHGPDDVQFLQVQMEGFGGWQPASTVPEEQLTKYFAKQAHEKIMLRRFRAQVHRGERVLSAVPMKPRTFLSSWSSVKPKAQSSCATHKEGDSDVVAAARTAGSHSDRQTDRQTETDRDGQRRTETDRDGQRHTERQRHRDTETERQRDRETDRQTDRPTDRQTDKRQRDRRPPAPATTKKVHSC